jgi:thioredoxin reductase (NADPH)
MFDSIIIGAGPAGLTASIYAARYKLKSLVIGNPIQSMATEAYLIENFPGFKSISGIELIEKMVEQAKNLGVEIIEEEVVEIKKKKIKDKNEFEVKTKTGKKIRTKTLILALGTEKKRLDVPGEKELLGRGISYCATCDAPLFKDKIVAVVGGANSALMAADLLSSYAKRIYLIYRKKKFRADPIYQEKIKKNKKIIPILETNIVKINGKDKIERVVLNKKYQKSELLKIDGLVVEIGSEPNTKLISHLKVATDANGYLKIKPDGSTNVAGIFAAGDITTGSNKFRQVITACAEGAVAAFGVYNYLKQL